MQTHQLLLIFCVSKFLVWNIADLTHAKKFLMPALWVHITG